MPFENIRELLKPYNNVFILGLGKSTGKTTVLNFLINEMCGKASIGITSVGLDGEKSGAPVTEGSRIYIYKGTCIATAKQCFLNSDFTGEIIQTTGIGTPLGEVIISRALSDGYAELSGPSLSSEVHEICGLLKKEGSTMVMVDGAVGRKTPVLPGDGGAVIISTGASLAADMAQVVEQTVYSVKILSLECEKEDDILKHYQSIVNNARAGLIYRDRRVRLFDSLTPLEVSKEIAAALDEDSEYVAIRGVVTDQFFKGIMEMTRAFSGKTFLVEDGTKLFVNRDTLHRFEARGGRIKVVLPIHVVGVAANPVSQGGYTFNRDVFLEKLEQSLNVPVFDPLGGENYSIFK